MCSHSCQLAEQKFGPVSDLVVRFNVVENTTEHHIAQYLQVCTCEPHRTKVKFDLMTAPACQFAGLETLFQTPQ